MPDLKQALKDYVATSNSGKYKDEAVLRSKFPELSNYDSQALKDYVATSNSGKYKSEDDLNSKFPELFGEKKKDTTQPSSTGTPTKKVSATTTGSSGGIGANGFQDIDVDLVQGGLQKIAPAKSVVVKPKKVAKEIQPESEAGVEPTFFEDVVSTVKSKMNKLATGSSQLGADFASIPELAYDVFAMPQNAIADMFDIPSLKADSEKFKKHVGIKNTIKESYQKEVIKLRDHAKTVDKFYQDGVYDSFKNGDILGGFDQLTNSFTESLPATASIMLGGAYVKTAQLVAASTMTFGAGKNEDLKKEQPDMNNNARVANALGTGLAEGVFETLGSGSIGAAARGLLEREGAARATSILKDGLADFYKAALKKNPLTASITGEGVEEWATKVTQNAVDVATGVKPQDYNIFEGGADAFIGGAFGGTVFGGGLKGLEQIANHQDKNKVKGNSGKIFELQKALDNPELSEETRAEINNGVDNLIKENQSLIQKGVKHIKELHPKIKDKLIESIGIVEDSKNKAKTIKANQEISNEQKKILLDNLKLEFKAANQYKTSILDGKSNVVDVLPLKEQDKLKRQALKELTAEQNPDGTKNIEIDNAQILERANKNYKANEKLQATITETQPQAEVQEPTDADQTKQEVVKGSIDGNTFTTKDKEKFTFEIFDGINGKVESIEDRENKDKYSFTIRDEKGEQAGIITFWKDEDGKFFSNNSFVKESYRGKGIASALYKYAQSLGVDIKPSEIQTDAGKGLWGKMNSNETQKDGNNVINDGIRPSVEPMVENGTPVEQSPDAEVLPSAFDRGAIEGNPEVKTKKVKSVKGATYDVQFDNDGNVTKIISPKDGREIVQFNEREVNDLDAKGKKQYIGDGKVKKKKVLVKNPNYAQIEADALGMDTDNRVKLYKEKAFKEAIDNMNPIEPRDIALKALASGMKVSLESVKDEVGNTDAKWATNQSDKTLPSVEKLAEQLSNGNKEIEKDIRDAIIEIINSNADLNSVKESVSEIYSENKKKQDEQELRTFIGSLSQKDLAVYESMKAEDDYLSELTDAEQQAYFEQEYESKTENYERADRPKTVDAGGTKPSQGVQESDGPKSPSEPKPTAKEKVEQRIKLSDDKIDAKAEAVKAKLKAFAAMFPSADINPDDYQKNGFSAEAIVDMVAKAAKSLMEGGILIDEAIKQAIAGYNTHFDDDVDADAVKQKMEPKADKGFQREEGKRSVLKRIREGGNSAEINDIIDRIGLDYERRNQAQVYADGVNFVKEVGIVEAYNAIKSGKLKHSDTINVVYATILQEFPKMADNEISKITETEELNSLVSELDDFHEKIYTEFASRTTDAGQGSSILNYIYNQDLKIRYSLSQQIKNFKKINNGVVPAEVTAKMKDLDKQYREANQRIEDLEALLKEAQEQQDFQNIVDEDNRTPKLSKTKREKAEKIIKALDDFEKSILRNSYSDATMITPILIQGIRAAKLAVKANVEISEAIEKAIEGIKKELDKLGKTFEDEERFRAGLNQALESNGVDTKKPKVTVDKTGKVRIPTEIIKDYISKGGTDLKEFSEQIHQSIQEEFPDVSVRDIRESVANYGKKANASKSQIADDIQRLKSEDRLRLEYEDLQNRIAKEKNEIVRRELSQTQKRLKEQIKQLQDDLGITETERTNRSVNYTKKRIKQLKERIENRDFNKKEIKPIVESPELKAAKIEKNRVQEEFDYLSYEHEMNNRTTGDKIGDFISDIYDSQRVTLATGEMSFVGAQGGLYMVDSTFSRKTLKNLVANFKGTTLEDWAKRPFKTMVKLAKSAHSTESLIEMFNKMGTANNYVEFQRLLKESPDYDVYLKSGLRILGEDVKSQVKDDNFIGNNILTLLRLPIQVVDRIEKKNLTKGKLTLADNVKKRTTLQGYYEKLKTGSVSDKNKKTADEMFLNANPLSTFERGNNTFMNMARIEMFNKYAAALCLSGKNPVDHLSDFKKLASAVNTVTGSGNMSQEVTMMLPVLNKAMFSARFFAASWNLTPPVSLYYLAKLGNYDGVSLKSPRSWKNIKPTPAQKAFVKPMLKGFVAFYGISLMTMALINSAIDDDDELTEEEKEEKRARIEYDPRSSDFMQVVHGNTRTDFFGPYRGNVVLLSKLISGQTKKNGEVFDNGAKYGSRTDFQIGAEYLGGKANPTPGMFIRYGMGKNEVVANPETGLEENKRMLFGKDIGIGYQIKHNTMPIFATTVKDVLAEDPTLGSAFYITWSLFGKQTSIYGAQAEKPSKHSKGPKKRTGPKKPTR